MPTLKNVWVNPQVHVIADELVDRYSRQRKARLAVTGLLCGL